MDLNFNFTVSCNCVRVLEAGWKVAELVSVIKEFIFQVTAPDNVQMQGSSVQDFVFKGAFSCKQPKKKKIQTNYSYHKLSDDLWFTN